MATRPTACRPGDQQRSDQFEAAFMARAEISSSGTNFSLASKRRPTSSMANHVLVDQLERINPFGEGLLGDCLGSLGVTADHRIVKLLQIGHRSPFNNIYARWPTDYARAPI